MFVQKYVTLSGQTYSNTWLLLLLLKLYRSVIRLNWACCISCTCYINIYSHSTWIYCHQLKQTPIFTILTIQLYVSVSSYDHLSSVNSQFLRWGNFFAGESYRKEQSCCSPSSGQLISSSTVAETEIKGWLLSYFISETTDIFIHPAAVRWMKWRTHNPKLLEIACWKYYFYFKLLNCTCLG